MADDRLRRLEREAAGGDPEARARLLRERARSGELPRERLGLAAWLGDPAAAAALGPEAPAPPEEVGRWAAGAARFGQEAFVRLGGAALRRVLSGRPAGASREAAERVLAASDAWTACPCCEHAEAARRAADAEQPPNLLTTFAMRANPSEWVVVEAAKVVARETRPEWTPEVTVELDPDAAAAAAGEADAGGEEAAALELLRDLLARGGATARWEEAGPDRLALRVADCGRLGTGGLARVLSRGDQARFVTLLEALRPIRERAAPVLYAAEACGAEVVRAAVREALLPWALGEPEP